jgi:hypothetical protein
VPGRTHSPAHSQLGKVKSKVAAEHEVVHSAAILVSEPMLKGASVVLLATASVPGKKPLLMKEAPVLLLSVVEPHQEP